MTDTRAEISESRQIEVPLADTREGRILLKLEGVRHSRRNFEVRFFVDSPEADAATPTEGNERYGGSFHMYGHGMPGEKVVGEAAVLEGYVPEVGKELEPFDGVIDITIALIGRSGNAPVPFTLVVLDEDGNQLPHTTFKFDHASLEVDD